MILREKSAGVNPGFTARDANGEMWFLAFDYAARPEGASAAVVIANKLFWALGYNQVETFLTTFDPNRVDDRSAGDCPAAVRRSHAVHDRRHARLVLDRARAQSRRHVSRLGRPRPAGQGPWRVSLRRHAAGRSRSIVPHEHRRELRALRVFGAWTNLTDLKAGNTLDTLVTENGRTFVKHYLQDVGSTFGMANGPHEWAIGSEYFFEADTSRAPSPVVRICIEPVADRRLRGVPLDRPLRGRPPSTRRNGSRRRPPRPTWKCAPTMRSGRRAGWSRSPTT